MYIRRNYIFTYIDILLSILGKFFGPEEMNYTCGENDAYVFIIQIYVSHRDFIFRLIKCVLPGNYFCILRPLLGQRKFPSYH